VDRARAFRYGDGVDDGSTPAPVLNGLLLPAWGYAYVRTGRQVYLTQGDRILEGLVGGVVAEGQAQKQFTQAYRSAARYLGFRAAPGPRAPAAGPAR
jgi:hypothetical protein